MKTFKVTVNGVSYDVTVEETDGTATPVAAAPAAPIAHAAPAAAPVTPVAPVAPVAVAPPAAAAAVVQSPMPGAILDIRVNIGDTVAKNQVVVILEAMKMENEIVTPSEGKIAAIHVSKGDSVNAGDPLVSIG